MNRFHKLGLHMNPTSAQATAAQMEKEADQVLYEVLDGHIALVTLNRPKRNNALTQKMQEEYFNALDRAEQDNNVRVIVVTGSGRSFCVGADMSLLQTIGDKGAKVGRQPSRSLKQLQALNICKPIICAINGSVAGLGFVLTSFTDIRFATRSAKMTTSFAQRGLVAEHGSSWSLPKIIGMSNALDILFSGRVFLGDEAKEMGYVTKVYDTPEQLMTEVLKYAREMAKKCSPASIAEMKYQVYNHITKEVGEAAQESEDLMIKSFKHPDVKEGVASYVEKRDPKWEGLTFGRIKNIQ